MSIFNVSPESPWAPSAVNLAGGAAFTSDDRYQLVSLLLTSFVKNKFYESKEEERSRLVELLKKVDPLFAAKAAISPATSSACALFHTLLRAKLLTT